MVFEELMSRFFRSVGSPIGKSEICEPASFVGFVDFNFDETRKLAHVT